MSSRAGRAASALLTGAVVALSIPACSHGRPDVAEQQPEPQGTPLLVHARVLYTTRNPMATLTSTSSFAAEFEHRMTVTQEADGLQYAFVQTDNDVPTLGLTGFVSATGTLDQHNPDGSWQVGRFDKHATLTDAAVPDAARCHIGMPDTAVAPGAPLQVSITCSAVVNGIQEMHGTTYDGPTRPLLPFANKVFAPIFLGCDDKLGVYPNAPADASVCYVQVTLFPTEAPKPSDGSPPNPAINAALGNYYGATTEYRTGHVVIHYAGSADLPAVGPGPAVLSLDVTVWSTGPDEEWRPVEAKRPPEANRP